MSIVHRAKNLVIGLVMLLCGIVMILSPEEGYLLAVLLLSVSLIYRGIRSLGYFFLMARNMVGGKSVLFTGIIALDLGMFTLTMTEVPRLYVILYLLGMNAFYGFVGVMRGFEAKKLQSPMWKWNTAQGVANILIALVSVIFFRSLRMIVYMYCIGVLYTAGERIVSAFRRTAVAYVSS